MSREAAWMSPKRCPGAFLPVTMWIVRKLCLFMECFADLGEVDITERACHLLISLTKTRCH